MTSIIAETTVSFYNEYFQNSIRASVSEKIMESNLLPHTRVIEIKTIQIY